MKIIRLTYPHTINNKEIPETVCAFGFFDGIHRGHQKLIQTAIDLAKVKGMSSAVMTFHPHPTDVLQKRTELMKYITPLKQKEAVLADMGVDILYIITFNDSLAALSPETFIDHFIDQLRIKHVIGGFDYTFGHKGKGTMDTMKNEAHGRYETTVIPKLVEYGDKISSTAIRNFLKEGNVIEVEHLLGRVFTVNGTVVTGEKRGRTIGFPTANINSEKDSLLPAVGVYAVTIKIKEDEFEGMANIGYKPTFHNNLQEATLEVYIFDFDRDIYDEDVSVSFHIFIREEKAFNGVNELVKQLDKDKETIQSFFQRKK